jgi:hypothetical protein
MMPLGLNIDAQPVEAFFHSPAIIWFFSAWKATYLFAP